MAFIDDIRGFEAGLMRRMRMSLEQARQRSRKRREFNRTYTELSRLTERELNDLGIARGDIAKVARAATGAE